MMYVAGANFYNTWTNILFETSVEWFSFTELGFGLTHLPSVIVGQIDGYGMAELWFALSSVLFYLTLPVIGVMALIAALRSCSGRYYMALSALMLVRALLRLMQFDLQVMFGSGLYVVIVLLEMFLIAALIMIYGVWHKRRNRKIPGLIELIRSR